MRAALFACIATALAGTVSIDIHKNESKSGKIGKGNTLFRELRRTNSKSLDTVTEQLGDQFFSYFATVYVGSDRQKVISAIDTGSSDLWVMTNTNPYCQDNDYCVGVLFDPETSSTYKNTTEPFRINYLDNSGAYGFLSQDTVEVGGVSLNNQYFGLVDNANTYETVFGISYTGNEAVGHYNRTSKKIENLYPNYPVALKNEGYINTISYSLYLNDLNAPEGVLLFGGVDHAKYSGNLGLVPVVNIYAAEVSQPIAFYVMLNDISVKSGGHSCPLVTDFNYPVLLDSGTSFGILPNRTVKAMADAYGYTWNDVDAFYEGDCNVFDFDGLELGFSGVNMFFPADSLIAPYTSYDDSVCALAIQTSDNPANFILGDVFLRSLYVVYDLENNQIAIGQAKFTEESDIEEIVSTIPSASSAPYYSSTQYILTQTTHDVRACQTKTTTGASINYFPNSDYLSTYYYGSPTSTTSFNSSAPTNSTATVSSSGSGSSSPKPSGYFNGSSSTHASASSSSSFGTTITATVPTPTILTTLGSTFTVSESTVLTITDCGCTETDSTETPSDTSSIPSSTKKAIPSESLGHGPVIVSIPAATTTTEVVSTLVTSCSGPTTFSTNGATYTVTDSTVLTITDCPCTLTHTIASTPSATTPSSTASSPASESPVESESPVAPTPASESPVTSSPASESPAGSSTNSAASTPAEESPSTTTTSSIASSSISAIASSASTFASASASSAPSVVPGTSGSTAPAFANTAMKNTFGASIVIALAFCLL